MNSSTPLHTTARNIALCGITALLTFAAHSHAAVAIYQDGLPDPFIGGTYVGTEDAMILDQGGGTGTDNFGARDDWEVGSNAAAVRHALLRFNITSMAGQYTTINSVTLKLTVNYANGAADTLQLFRFASANASWVEGTQVGADGIPDPGMTTWNQRVQGADNWAGSAGASTGGTDYLSTAVGSIAFDNSLANGTLVSITLTDPTLIDDWVSGDNSGLFLRALNELPATLSRVDFYSADYTTDPTDRPQLAIDYEAVPEPASGLLGMIGTIALLCHRRRNTRNT